MAAAREIIISHIGGDIEIETESEDAEENDETATTDAIFTPDSIAGDPVIIDVTAAETEDHFYHPSRLSPKLIGEYPAAKLAPTCLGVSILLASFFHKAGVPMLHTGVMRTAQIDSLQALAQAGDELRWLALKRDITLPEVLEAKIDHNTKNYIDAKQEDRGFHAGVLLKAYDDLWVYLDPNAGTNVLVDKLIMNCDTVLADLNKASRSLGGVEFSVNQTAKLIPKLLYNILTFVADRLPPAEEVNQLIDTLNESDAPLAMLHAYVRPIIDRRSKSRKTADRSDLQISLEHHIYEKTDLATRGEPEAVRNKIWQEYQANIHVNADAMIHEAIDTAIQRYVFPHTSKEELAAVLQRCQDDPAYRQERLDMLTLLPSLALVRLIGQVTDDVLNAEAVYPHAYMEVGLLEHRIGMCVLSDFASHTGDALPPSFWTSHWSSGIAWYAHSRENVRNDNQYKVARNIARVLESSWLTYSSNHEKITSFLEQGSDYHPTRE